MRTERPRIEIIRRARVLAPALAALVMAGSISAAPPDAPTAGPVQPVLNLAGGGGLTGELADSDRPGILRWKSPAFVDPFAFATSRTNAVHWPPPAQPAKTSGAYRFELAEGDVLYGDLLGLDDAEATLDVPRLGKLHVERSALRRIVRRGGETDTIYAGPNGLVGWSRVAPVGAWQEEGGEPLTRQDGASLRGNFNLPAKVVVEFELSWKAKPDFVLALGVDDSDFVLAPGVDRAAASREHPFRFEVWEGDLVASRDTDAEADVLAIQKIGNGEGHLHLRAYLDQERGRMIVFSASGHPFGELQVAARTPRVLPGIELTNLKGDVRLERLRITAWNGDSPSEVQADGPGLRLADGSIAGGKSISFDPAAHEFVVTGDKGVSRVAEDKVASAMISSPKEDSSRAIRVVNQDGSRLSGSLLKVESGDVVLSVPGLKETPRLPSDSVRTLLTLKPDVAATAIGEQIGRLELEGVLLPGRLVEGPGASGPAWLPLGGESASAFRPGVSGRIVYKESPATARPGTPNTATIVIGQPAMVAVAPVIQFEADAAVVVKRVDRVAAAQPAVPAGAVVMQRVQPARAVLAEQPGRAVPRIAAPAPMPAHLGLNIAQRFLGVMGDVAPRPLATQPPIRTRRALHLRTGDILPCEVTKIDEAGVTFKSPLSDITFVPHEKIKAVELAPEPPPDVRLNKAKRERLLTLPRLQKDSPPTQLVRSKNGDYLRGRVVGLDDKNLQVEIHLETKEIPRDRISRIIWLHPDELDPAKVPAAPPAAGGRLLMQAKQSDGVRMTLAAEHVEGEMLSGKSDVLGTCRVKLGQVDEILIGSAIGQAAAKLAYGQWKLKNAEEPKVADDDGGGADGTRSALVGKPAPDFDLELLDGKRFQLSKAKGRVVVLDFWATWCGPCLQAMPQVERVTQEFKDQGVQLIAVNLQEAPKEITAMLERHKLKLDVALDRDGVVAEKYAANAIPQTVIIDRDGTIARLFVGGGPRFGDDLRAALDSVVKGEPSRKPDGPEKPDVLKD